MERNMTNEKIVLNCIAALNNCDINSAVWFAEHNKTCYDIAMAVAQAKDEKAEAEKQALIDKACEWMGEFLRNHYIMRYEDYCEPCKDRIVEEFKQAMKGGE